MRRTVTMMLGLLFTTAARAQDASGTVTLPDASVPFSRHASPEARAVFARDVAVRGENWAARPIAEARAHYDAINRDRVHRLRDAYHVAIVPGRIAGIPVETITPTEGVPARNRGRVLINLHGGAFRWGAGAGGEVESIPIAALAKITVISVDYRMAPEYRFPAASEDVAAVYRALLKHHRPRAIGIYGCSSGGALTGQSVAWLHARRLPMPGAIGTFCGSIAPPEGDSASIAPALTGQAMPRGPGAFFTGYMQGTSADDPLVIPGSSPALLADFPPTLLITGTRDYTMSNVVQAQRLLTNAGVETELHVWDGMWHAFLYEPDMPESREAYRVIAAFFDRKLAR